MTQELLTLADVAEELGCSVATVKRRIRAGRLPAFVDGRLVRVRSIDLTRYITERIVRHSAASMEGPSGHSLAPGSRLWD
jgi:excisionase family DNA binding protein